MSHFVNDQTSLQKCLHRVMQNHTKAWAKVKWRYFCSKREKSGKGITFSGALILTFSGRKKKFSTKNSFLHTSPLQSAKSKEPQVALKIQFMFAILLVYWAQYVPIWMSMQIISLNASINKHSFDIRLNEECDSQKILIKHLYFYSVPKRESYQKSQ